MRAIASLQVVATTGGPERSFLGDGAAARWQWLAGSEGEYTAGLRAGLPVYHGRRALDRELRKSKGLVTRFGGCWILPRCPFFALGMSKQQKAEGISV